MTQQVLADIANVMTGFFTACFAYTLTFSLFGAIDAWEICGWSLIGGVICGVLAQLLGAPPMMEFEDD